MFKLRQPWNKDAKRLINLNTQNTGKNAWENALSKKVSMFLAIASGRGMKRWENILVVVKVISSARRANK